MVRAERTRFKSTGKRVQVKAGQDASNWTANQVKSEGRSIKQVSDGLLPTAYAQTPNQKVNTGGTQVGDQPEYSVEKFIGNVIRGAEQTGRSYSTDIIDQATGSYEDRTMKEDTLFGAFTTGALEGRLHDSLAEAGRRIVHEPGRVVGEVAVETAFMIGTMGVGVAAKGIKAGAVGAKIMHTNPITGKTITGYQRVKSGLTRLRGKAETKYIGDQTTTYIKTDRKGKVKVKTESNRPTLTDPARPLARKIEKAAQPVGEKLRAGVNKATGGRRGKPKQAEYQKEDPFNPPTQQVLNSNDLITLGQGAPRIIKAGTDVGGGWNFDEATNTYSKGDKVIKSGATPNTTTTQGASVIGSSSTKKQTKKPSNAFTASSIPLGAAEFNSPLQFTPEKITELKPNQIVVYGANDGGPQGAYLNYGGAADMAAKLGAGRIGRPGIVNQTYGVVTKAAPNNQPGSFYSGTPEGTAKVGSNMKDLAQLVKQHPESEFIFTGFGTGKAGFKPQEIVSMFEGDEIIQSNIVLPKVFFNQLSDTQKAKYLDQRKPTSTKKPSNAFTASSIPLGAADIIPMAYGDGATPPVGLDPVTGAFLGRNIPGAGTVKGYVELPNLQSSTMSQGGMPGSIDDFEPPIKPQTFDIITGSSPTTPNPLNPTYPGAPKSFVSEVDKITDEQLAEQINQIIPPWGGKTDPFNAAQYVANTKQKDKLVDEAIARVKANKKIKRDKSIDSVSKSKSDSEAESGYDMNPVDSFSENTASKEQIPLSEALGSFIGQDNKMDTISQIMTKQEFERTHGNPQPIEQGYAQDRIKLLWEERISQGVPVEKIRDEENKMIVYWEEMNQPNIVKTNVQKNPDGAPIPENTGMGTDVQMWGIDSNTNIAESVVPQKVQPNVKTNPMYGQDIRQQNNVFELPVGDSQWAPGTITPYKGVDILGMGAQTGVDQGAGRIGSELGIKVVGNVPRDFKTESGPLDDSLRQLWDLKENFSADYPVRTRLNIGQSDATVVFYPTVNAEGKTIGPGKGTSLTIEQAIAQGKPLLINPPTSETLNSFLAINNVRKLNVGGTRGSDIPKGSDFISNMEDILRGMKINTGNEKNISQYMSSRELRLTDNPLQKNQQVLTVEGTIIGYGGGGRTKTDIKQFGKDKQKLGDDTTRDMGALTDDDPIISGVSTRLSDVDVESMLAAGRLEFDQPLVGGISELEVANPGIKRAIEKAWLKEENRVADLSKKQGKTVKPKISEISKTVKDDFGIIVPVDQLKEIKRLKKVRTARTNYKAYRKKLMNFLDGKPQGKGKKVRSDVNVIEGIGPGFLNLGGGLSVPVVRQGVRPVKPNTLQRLDAKRLPPTLDDYANRYNMTWKNVETTLILNKDKYTDAVQQSAFNRGEVPESKVVFRGGFIPPIIRKTTKRAKDLPYTGKEKESSLFTKANFAEIVGSPKKGEKGYAKNIDIEREIGVNEVLVTRGFDLLRGSYLEDTLKIAPKPKINGKKLKARSKRQEQTRLLQQGMRVTLDEYERGVSKKRTRRKGKGKGKGRKQNTTDENTPTWNGIPLEVNEIYSNYMRMTDNKTARLL